jgi:hypothetical protein
VQIITKDNGGGDITNDDDKQLACYKKVSSLRRDINNVIKFPFPAGWLYLL